MSSDEYSQMTNYLENNLNRTEKNVIAVKRRKYLRDKNDYARDQVRSYSKRNQEEHHTYYRPFRQIERHESRIDNREQPQIQFQQKFIPTTQQHKPSGRPKPLITPEKVVRRKEHNYELRPRLNSRKVDHREHVSYERTRPIPKKRGLIPLENRYEVLNKSPREEVFWRAHKKDRHKELDNQRGTPGKRRRSIEEGEVEEEFTYRKELRDRNRHQITTASLI
ncbi:Hypothetical predicted protein [Pelobates cultripes]|uniref:Uncharacterized protein n=1 Tax=Pelobates cultripes TaxID=61616 RepID=A0AAD1WEU5_PELCU|nr:Hypothetical predicted protein [Pelobates cultripes]